MTERGGSQVSAYDRAERVHADTREQWRSWLADDHASAASAWLVSWKKHTGKPTVGYEDSVREAVAFGWIDSKGMTLDADRTMLYFARRKPGSAWSRSNKLRIEELKRDGLMAEAGLRAIEAAKADGSWTLLDDVDALIVPVDLATAFERHPGASEKWESFPRTAKRAILEWIMQAKKPETRTKRIEQTASSTANGVRAR